MRAVAAGLVLVVVCACASATGVSGERRDVGNVTVTFTVVPSNARPGQSIRLTIRLVNNGGTPAELTFATTQKYDFWVTDGGRELWRWSAGQVFAPEVTRQEIGGQTGAVFAESWSTAQTGRLVAHGELKARSYEGEMKGDLVVS
jgi:hypothetical protein